MNDDRQRYLDQARRFAAQAGLAATEEARHAFVRLAAVFAELARDAAADNLTQRDAA